MKRNGDNSITRSWRYTYRFPKGSNTQDETGIGQYPSITLAEARRLHDEARAMVEKGINPRLAKKATRKADIASAAATFEVVAREWWNAGKWEAKHKQAKLSQFERFVFPVIGYIPVADVQVSDVMDVLRRIVSTGVTDTHMRVNSNIKLVFDYAIPNYKLKFNPAASITPKMVKDAMPGMTPHVKKHYAALKDPAEISVLLKAIDGYKNLVVRAALQLSVLFWQRPTEIRLSSWEKVYFERMELVIPAKNRKLKTYLKELDRPEDAHIVPLANQAISILRDLHSITGNGRYVFQSFHKANSPIGSTTLNPAMARLGFKGKQTAHGFRHLASSALAGMKRPDGSYRWSKDAIERQLSHRGVTGEDTDTALIYRHLQEYMEERREMMQAWADYLDGLKAG